MPVTELYAFNLICENLLMALYGVALNHISHLELKIQKLKFVPVSLEALLMK